LFSGLPVQGHRGLLQGDIGSGLGTCSRQDY